MASIRDKFTLISQMAALPFKYKKSIAYKLKHEGLRGVLDFLFVKYNVAEEGGEMAFLNIIYRKNPSATPIPFKVEMEHTTVCDKKCIMCEHTYWNEKQQFVNFETFKSIMDGFPKLRWIGITGEGSGFLNPDFIKMLEYLKTKRVSINFIDEMEFLDEEKAKKIIELGVNCICVSFDGATKETYESVKVGCDFDKVIKNIKYLTKLKKEYNSPFPSICFKFIASSINVHEMPLMPKLIHELDCIGEGSRIEFVGVLKFKEIEQYYIPRIPADIIEKTKIEGEKYNLPINFAHSDEELLPDMSKCSAWVEPFIMIDGQVLPCCAGLMSNRRDFLKKHALGNIREKSISEIWQSERYKKMRDLIVNEEGEVPILCAGCRAFNTKQREEKYGISKDI